jgi:hypothetical protein
MEQSFKKCFKCGIVKPLDAYYKHPQMGDGHLNKCKECNKKDTADNAARKMQDPIWVEKEKDRHRKKALKQYHREKGTPKLAERKKRSGKAYNNKYPEKYKAKISAAYIECPKDFHRHHWSYKEENSKDVIIIDDQDHFFVHRYLKYVQSEMCYKTPDGTLLDSREKHEQFISNILKLKPLT